MGCSGGEGGEAEVDEFEIEAGEAGVGVLFEAVGDVDAGAGLEGEGGADATPVGATGPAYGVDCGFIVAVAESEGDVFVLDDADGGGEGEVEGGEDGLGVADAEGAAAR